jgi:CHASE3 domain sensor protein
MREIEKYLKDMSSFYRKMAQEEEKIANRYLLIIGGLFILLLIISI